jgi:proline racemase
VRHPVERRSQIADATTIHTFDYHTAGEPFRIVPDADLGLSGDTVAQRRVAAASSAGAEHVRMLLCHEPRGHADMYGGFIVPPDDSGADLGVLFWHKDGYSTACGHGTIALGVWAVESGLVAADPDGETAITIDVPSGRVMARVRSVAGAIRSVVFENVPSYPIARAVPVKTAHGTIRADLSFSGAIYASVAATDLGLEVKPEHYTELIALGREIKWALNDSEFARHPHDDRLSGVYGTIIFDDLGDTETGPHQRNVTVFADGEVDRSPCGSGTGARLALLADSGRISPGQTLTHDSIIGTSFLGRVRPGPAGTVIPEVEGMAYATGTSQFVLDPADPVGTGFVLR